MRIVRFIIRGLLFLTLAIVIAGGLLVFQMSTGTLSAGFLKDRLVAAALARLPEGSQLALDHIEVGFGPDWSLVAESRGLSVFLPGQGKVDAAATRTEIATGALVKGAVEPIAVTIDDMAIEIERQPAVNPTGARADFIRDALNNVSVAVLGVAGRLNDSGLQKIEATNIRVAGGALQDARISGGQPIRISALQWQPSAKGGELNLELLSSHGGWSMALVPGADPDGRAGIDFTVSEFPPAFLYPPITDPQRRPYFDAVADMQGRIQLDENDLFDVARAHVTLGSGYLSLLQNDAAIIDRIDVAVELSSASDQLKVARSDIRFGGSHVVFRGGFELADFGESVGFGVELGETKLSPFGEGQEPVLLDSGVASGVIDIAAGAVHLRQAAISGPEGAARAVGSFRSAGKAPGLSGAVTVDETTARMVRALWPPILARKTRSWFDQNVKSALIGPGTVQIALPKENLGRSGKDRPLPPDGVVGELSFRYGLFTPLRDLPLVRNAFGALEFADATAIIHMDRADVTAAGFGTASVNNTEFRIPELGKPDPVGLLDLNISGPAAALAQLSNAGRLNIAEDRGLAPTALSGEADLSLKARFALTKKARPDDINADFDLKLAGFASKEPITGQLISAADLAVRGTPASFTVQGNARIDGIPAKIDVSSGNGENPSTVRLTMDEAARKKHGIDLGRFLIGPVIASVTPQADGQIQDISIDLKPAAVNLPFLGWEKGAGIPATFKARIKRTASGTEVRNILVSGEGFQASGEIDIGVDGNLASLDMRDITLRSNDDFAISASASGNGYRVSVSGNSFDARGLIGYLKSGTTGLDTSGRKFSVSIKLSQLRGFNGVSLSGVSGSLVASGGKLRALSLQAGVGTAQPVEFIIGEAAEQRTLTLRSGNGGALLRFINVYEKAFGGDLVLQFAGSKSVPDGDGTLSFTNFRVQNEQVFDQAAIERRSNPDREIRSTDVMIDSTNINFAKLKIPFRKQGDAVVFSEASLRGPVIGASGKGTVDLKARNLSISGTIVPAYGINNLPGSIPILGQLLGGRKREGLIGITYQMYGPVDSPTLKLNPASAIAPGIFRRIFEY